MTQAFFNEIAKLRKTQPADTVMVFHADDCFCYVYGVFDCMYVGAALGIETQKDVDGAFYMCFKTCDENGNTTIDDTLSRIALRQNVAYCERGEPKRGICHYKVVKFIERKENEK